jgi:hypothetical protein
MPAAARAIPLSDRSQPVKEAGDMRIRLDAASLASIHEMHGGLFVIGLAP